MNCGTYGTTPGCIALPTYTNCDKTPSLSLSGLTSYVIPNTNYAINLSWVTGTGSVGFWISPSTQLTDVIDFLSIDAVNQMVYGTKTKLCIELINSVPSTSAEFVIKYNIPTISTETIVLVIGAGIILYYLTKK